MPDLSVEAVQPAPLPPNHNLEHLKELITASRALRDKHVKFVRGNFVDYSLFDGLEDVLSSAVTAFEFRMRATYGPEELP